MNAAFTADEFARESRAIEDLVWEALCVEAGTRVLFCGYGTNAAFVRRSLDAGANVSVVEHRDDPIRALAQLPVTLLRGSTSVIPAAANAYDLAIAFHYLHETDPTFHRQIVFELARVARRVAIVEPAPPGDPLGKRIAALYGQAKRNLGQFETYQTLEYWKKLLRSAKADVALHAFAFSKVPPQEYVADTIALLLDTMKAEQIPQTYLEEMREIARHPGALLLPPARFVLTGAAAGDLPQIPFTRRLSPAQPEPVPEHFPPAAGATRAADVAAPGNAAPFPEISPATGYEFPPVDAPTAPPASLADVATLHPFENAPAATLDEPTSAPFGTPFTVAPLEGWQWEPPVP